VHGFLVEPEQRQVAVAAREHRVTRKLGAKVTPELTFLRFAMPFVGFTEAQYAQTLIDE
jgi:hypothetical protein